MFDPVATAPGSDTPFLACGPDQRKNLSDHPQAGGHHNAHHDPEFPVATEHLLPAGLNAEREIHVQFRSSKDTRRELHDQVPGESVNPGDAIHSHSAQNDQSDRDSPDVSKEG